MLMAKCDNCGCVEVARVFKEPSQKPQWCEPKTWLRRWGGDGTVVGVFCSYECEKASLAKEPNLGKHKK